MMATRTATVKLKEKFLARFSECGNVQSACATIGIGRTTLYQWKERDPAFKTLMDAAGEDAADRLETEAWRRAHDGIDKPIYHNGDKIDTIKEYSDTLLIFLLNGLRPQKYRRGMPGMEGGDGGQVTIVIQQFTAPNGPTVLSEIKTIERTGQ